MSPQGRHSEVIHAKGVTVETFLDGEGSPLVILPSYGRDGGQDYDDITSRLVGESWKVIRPQPRGIVGTSGPMENLTLHDLAGDVVLCIRALARQPVVIIGQAFGNVLARVVTTDYPDLVKAVVLAAAEASKVPGEIRRAPFVAGDTARPEPERLAALQTAFFAPNHDATIWLSGWYPATLKIQQAAVKKTDLHQSSACGSVPLLQVFGEDDPFVPRPYWHELRDQLGDRVTLSIVKNASHSLFPEQPERVAETIVPWVAQFKRRSLC